MESFWRRVWDVDCGNLKDHCHSCTYEYLQKYSQSEKYLYMERIMNRNIMMMLKSSTFITDRKKKAGMDRACVHAMQACCCGG
jgi:hypothetical protein